MKEELNEELNDPRYTYVCCECHEPLTKSEMEYNRVNELSGYCEKHRKVAELIDREALAKEYAEKLSKQNKLRMKALIIQRRLENIDGLLCENPTIACPQCEETIGRLDCIRKGIFCINKHKYEYLPPEFYCPSCGRNINDDELDELEVYL